MKRIVIFQRGLYVRPAHHMHRVCIGVFYTSIVLTVVGVVGHVEVHHADVVAIANDALARLAHALASGD